MELYPMLMDWKINIVKMALKVSAQQGNHKQMKDNPQDGENIYK